MNGIICYIGIGSNLGNALKNCQYAVENLSLSRGIEITGVSSFYKTEPVGIENQNYFVNAVVEIKTILSARNILETLHNIENDMGRKREMKGGPRIIDIDLLFYGRDVIREADLIVPHPEIHERRFVLEPLCEIASYFIHPAFGISIRGLKERLRDNKIVEMIKE
ncbi:MAG: 2-amino-4-hydroxy-6-hydroxymethyldihydropteridine diphosphokinase [Deltaproteobacteria bacterium]|nr:2-amino-4-hydroxy-6-hydroxymethyldihydropteridine diphosphokinase [Deltaproteobacteria bacterium]